MERDKVNFLISISSYIPEEMKTAAAIVIAWFYSFVGDNPVGVFASLIGLLYAFERYRTQRAERRLKEKELKDKLNEPY